MPPRTHLLARAMVGSRFLKMATPTVCNLLARQFGSGDFD
jgi:hypothetical protein